MRRPGGYAHWFNGQGPDIERDTFTCKHCNAVVHVEPFQSASDTGGWCFSCHAPVCRHCAGKECVTFERRMEQIERNERLLGR